MANRADFADLLYNTCFDSISDEAVYKSQIATIRSWIKSNIPTKLYQYRAVRDWNINAFYNNQLFGGSILSFNDPLECLPCYDTVTINNALKQEFEAQSVASQIEQLLNGTPPTNISKLLPPEYIAKLTESLSFPDSLERLEQNLNEYYYHIITYVNSILDDLEKAFFSEIMHEEHQYKIACLSETNTSSLMWGHYADSHKGFCLEYDISSILQDCSELCSNIRYCSQFMMTPAIAPVIYSNKRFDASSAFTSMIINHLNQKLCIPSEKYFYDMLLTTKTLLTKAVAWSYEKEWRIFKKDTDSTQHQPILNIQATAAYLGINMTPKHKSQIIDICTEKNIPCYQMAPQYFNSSYEIRPIAVDNSTFK